MKAILSYVSEFLLYLMFLVAGVLLLPFAWWLEREEGKLESVYEEPD